MNKNENKKEKELFKALTLIINRIGYPSDLKENFLYYFSECFSEVICNLAYSEDQEWLLKKAREEAKKEKKSFTKELLRENLYIYWEDPKFLKKLAKLTPLYKWDSVDISNRISDEIQANEEKEFLEDLEKCLLEENLNLSSNDLDCLIKEIRAKQP